MRIKLADGHDKTLTPAIRDRALAKAKQQLGNGMADE